MTNPMLLTLLMPFHTSLSLRSQCSTSSVAMPIHALALLIAQQGLHQTVLPPSHAPVHDKTYWNANTS